MTEPWKLKKGSKELTGKTSKYIFSICWKLFHFFFLEAKKDNPQIITQAIVK